MSGAWLAPYGTRMASINTFLIAVLILSFNMTDSNICETKLYFEFTATNRICGPKVDKTGYFLAFFFYFRNVTVELIIFEEAFCLFKFRAPLAITFSVFFEFRCNNFQLKCYEKTD